MFTAWMAFAHKVIVVDFYFKALLSNKSKQKLRSLNLHIGHRAS